MGQEGGGDAAEDGRGAGAAGAHGMEDEDDVVTLLYEEVTSVVPFVRQATREEKRREVNGLT